MRGNCVEYGWSSVALRAEDEEVYSADMTKKGEGGPATGLSGWVMRRLGVPAWGQLLLLVLAPLVTGGAVTLWRGHDRLGKIETSIRVLASKQAPDVKDLIKELLSQAQDDFNSGRTTRAQKALAIVPVLLSSAKRTKIPAEPAFFSSSAERLNQLQSNAARGAVIEEIRSARITLAEYRSVLNRAVPSPGARVYVVSKVIDERTFQFKVPEEGLVLDLKDYPAGLSLFRPGFFPRKPSGLTVDNPERPAFIMNGTQELDRRAWVNVVFLNMRIKYSGGSTELKNVKFVDCTFEFDADPRSDRLADYVALGLPTLFLRGEG